jgi:adenine phosphoribosyltransferase
MSSPTIADAVRARIRDVPDFPKPGIVFKDVTPVLEDAATFKALIGAMAEPWRGAGIAKVVAIESRGFIFGAPIALELGAGFVLVRKAGKLPAKTRQASYALEYGEGVIEMHVDAVRPGERVLIVDDLLATGGTAAAAASLVRDHDGVVAGFSFLVDLAFLGGGKKLAPTPMKALLTY